MPLNKLATPGSGLCDFPRDAQGLSGLVAFPPVFWITGLAGSGKSTLAIELAREIRSHGGSCIVLDGDVLREAFGDSLGHDVAARLVAAWRYARLASVLSRQGVIVICATISLFHEVQTWNRSNIPNLVEVFVDVPMKMLMERDKKGLYSGSLSGTVCNVVGMDINAEFPLCPDVHIHGEVYEKPHEMASILFRRYCVSGE
jgi:adenylylsulfate kinase-like enzyme